MSPLSNGGEEENASPLHRSWEDDDNDEVADGWFLSRDEPRRRLIFQPWNGTGSENETPTSSSSLQPFVTISFETEGESPGRQSREEEEEREERREERQVGERERERERERETDCRGFVARLR